MKPKPEANNPPAPTGVLLHPVGSARLTKLEAKLVEQLAHVRVESTHGLAGQCRCSISGANSALMRLHRQGLVGIEHKGVRGTHGYPTVWYKEAPNDKVSDGCWPRAHDDTTNI